MNRISDTFCRSLTRPFVSIRLGRGELSCASVAGRVWIRHQRSATRLVSAQRDVWRLIAAETTGGDRLVKNLSCWFSLFRSLLQPYDLQKNMDAFLSLQLMKSVLVKTLQRTNMQRAAARPPETRQPGLFLNSSYSSAAVNTISHLPKSDGRSVFSDSFSAL